MVSLSDLLEQSAQLQASLRTLILHPDLEDLDLDLGELQARHGLLFNKRDSRHDQA